MTRRLRSRPDERRVQQAYDRDGARCSECGIDKRLSIHHIVRQADGGTHDLDNLAVLCRRCHDAKHH